MTKIFITGASGFLGTNLLRELSKNSKIKILALVNKNPLKDKKNVRICKSNIIKPNAALKRELISFKPDVVIHLAAYNFIPLCERNKDVTYMVNVHGMYQLLNVLRSCKPQYFIFTSTSGLYESDESSSYEKSPISITNTYLLTKHLNEQMLHRFLPNTKKIVLRISNIYGLHCKHSFIIQKIINHIQQNKYPIKIGNSKTIRDFIHVDDVASGINQVVHNLPKQFSIYEVFNLAFGESHSIEQIFNIVKKHFSQVTYISTKEYKRNNDKQIIRIDSDKFKKTFNWSPRITLNEFFLKLRKDHE